MGLDRVWFMWRLPPLPTLPISTVKHINSTILQLYTAKTENRDKGVPGAEILWYNLRRFCGELTVFIYEEQNWPTFRWDASHLESALARTAFHEGQLLGRLQDIGFETQRQASCVIAAQEIVASHAIEGEQLDAESVRSSVARHLDLAVASPERGDHRSDALAEMLLDATQKAAEPLTLERLFAWHSCLFPTGFSGMTKISVGKLRTDEDGPMLVVSRGKPLPRIHFRAPPAERLPQEMAWLLAWFNADMGGMPLFIRAGLAHLWFLTLHPFDDGNGRLARVLTDSLIARGEGMPFRFYSVSDEICRQKGEYYLRLERAQRSGLDVTPWLEWFIQVVDQAIIASGTILGRLLQKTRFWRRYSMVALNARQIQLLNRLWDGFEGNMTSSKWAKIGKCSQDTAARELAELVSCGALQRVGQGRSTHYVLGMA